MEALDSWGVSSKDRTSQAKTLAAAWDGQPSALPGLLELASRESSPVIIRASAALATLNYPSQETLFTVQKLLSSDDSLVRASAVRSMDWLPEAQRYALLRDLITDRSKSVRMAVARQLLGFPADQLPAESARELNSLWREYLEAMRLNADMPEEQLNLGMFHLAAGDPIAAEKAYRTALKLSPFFIPAMLNLADLYRANGMDAQAEPLLQRAISLAPDAAPPHHAIGLLRVRQNRLEEAVPSLRTAARAEPQNYRYSYVYAVALWETGRKEEAVTELESALERVPGNREIVSALGSYYQQLGEQGKTQVVVGQVFPVSQVNFWSRHGDGSSKLSARSFGCSVLFFQPDQARHTPGHPIPAEGKELRGFTHRAISPPEYRAYTGRFQLHTSEVVKIHQPAAIPFCESLRKLVRKPFGYFGAHFV